MGGLSAHPAQHIMKAAAPLPLGRPRWRQVPPQPGEPSLVLLPPLLLLPLETLKKRMLKERINTISVD